MTVDVSALLSCALRRSATSATLRLHSHDKDVAFPFPLRSLPPFD
jgi:hypothetical protein